MLANCKLSAVIFFILFGLSSAVAKKPGLAVADSLYEMKQYSQALPLYKALYFEEGLSTPAMLLKLAQLEEMEENYAYAMYFLHTYHAQQPAQEVKLKMASMAEALDFKGYYFGELDFLFRLYRQFHASASLLLLNFSGLILLFMIWLRVKGQELANWPILFITFLLGFLLVNNLKLYYQQGIVSAGPTLLMEAPSAGANVLGRITAGHKLLIKDKKDIWYKVGWEGKDVYISENQILLLR